MNIPRETTLSEGARPADTPRQAATLGASWRKHAAAAGVLFLISDVFAVVAAILYGPAQNNAGYITGSGSDTQVLLGAFFEVIVALAVVGTAVALFPVVKRQNEGVALGYVGLRTLEAGIIAVGVVPLLVVVTLRQHLAATAGADTAALVTLGSALVAFFNWSLPGRAGPRRRGEHGADSVPGVQVPPCTAVHPRAGTGGRPTGLRI